MLHLLLWLKHRLWIELWLHRLRLNMLSLNWLVLRLHRIVLWHRLWIILRYWLWVGLRYRLWVVLRYWLRVVLRLVLWIVLRYWLRIVLGLLWLI